ncbi:MAG: hypothetical protein ACOX1I_00375 [Dethiobacteria bacterium]
MTIPIQHRATKGTVLAVSSCDSGDGATAGTVLAVAFATKGTVLAVALSQF